MKFVPFITRADVSPNLFIALLPAIIVALVVLAIVGLLLYLRFKKAKPGTEERIYLDKNDPDGNAPDPLLLNGYVRTQDGGLYPGAGSFGGGDGGGSSN